MTATIAWTSATVGQRGTSNLQGFQAHHPPTYMGGGDFEREVDDTRSIRDMGAGAKRKVLLVRERGRRLRLLECFRNGAATIRAKAKPRLLPSQDR